MDPLLVLVVIGVAPLPFKADESDAACQHWIQFFALSAGMNTIRRAFPCLNSLRLPCAPSR